MGLFYKNEDKTAVYKLVLFFTIIKYVIVTFFIALTSFIASLLPPKIEDLFAINFFIVITAATMFFLGLLEFKKVYQLKYKTPRWLIWGIAHRALFTGSGDAIYYGVTGLSALFAALLMLYINLFEYINIQNVQYLIFTKTSIYFPLALMFIVGAIGVWVAKSKYKRLTNI